MTGAQSANDRSWDIHAAVPADADALGRLHVRCWHETYDDLVPAALLARFSVDRSREVWSRILGEPAAHAAAAVYLLRARAATDATQPSAADRSAAELWGFGSCCAQRSPDLAARGFDAEISALYLLRSRQRHGLGGMLLRSLVGDLIARKFQALSLWVLEANAPARAFYERCGGIVVAEKQDVREDGTLLETAYGWPSLDVLRDHLGAPCGAGKTSA
jgi:ribosomal protein S18 acetylase RimI-like enzyme